MTKVYLTIFALVLTLLLELFAWYVASLPAWSDGIVVEKSPRGYFQTHSLETLVGIYGQAYWDGKQWRFFDANQM